MVIRDRTDEELFFCNARWDAGCCPDMVGAGVCCLDGEVLVMCPKCGHSWKLHVNDDIGCRAQSNGYGPCGCTEKPPLTTPDRAEEGINRHSKVMSEMSETPLEILDDAILSVQHLVSVIQEQQVPEPARAILVAQIFTIKAKLEYLKSQPNA